MDNTDRALLNLLQEGIPLTEEPYRELGERLGGLSAQEVIARITRLMEDGWIRRFSGFFTAGSVAFPAFFMPPRSGIILSSVPCAFRKSMSRRWRT